MILTLSLGFGLGVLVWALAERHRLRPSGRTIIVYADAFGASSPSARAAQARAIVDKVLA